SKINQDGSWAMGGIQIPTQYGPSSAKNSITVLSNHLNPQTGLTIYDDKIKLLVSVDNQVYQKENATLPASFEPCDTPYPQNSTGEVVLYMPANSTGKLCVRYHNLDDNPKSIGIRISEASRLDKDAPEITTWNDSGNNMLLKGNSTVIYWIKTGNHAGFYGLTIFCVPMPFAVGYDDNSTFVKSDFPWLIGNNTWFCPSQGYDFHIDSMTGIGVKYIPYP
ncbi:MAG: hypothetical protein KGH87_09820, partial [Thaumarchaeota archaeon]|nr:hypothetical protein [Nitrososphaerota archaeon]